MTTTDRKDASRVLDETASSLKRLVRDLEDRETQGSVVTTTEIQTIAGQLQTHVEELVAASKGLRELKL
jgi:hypothetical protein